MAPKHKLYCRHITAAYLMAPQPENTRKMCQASCESTNFKMRFSEVFLPSISTHPRLSSSENSDFSANICASQQLSSSLRTSRHPLLLRPGTLIFLLSFGLHTMGRGKLLRDLAGKCFGNISSAIYFEGVQEGQRVVSIPAFVGCRLWVGFWVIIFGYCPELH